MTAKEAAQRLGVSPSMVYALVEEKRLSCIRIGRKGRKGKIIIRECDIEKFEKSVEQEASTGA